MMLRQALQSPWSIDDPEAAARIICKEPFGLVQLSDDYGL